MKRLILLALILTACTNIGYIPPEVLTDGPETQTQQPNGTDQSGEPGQSETPSLTQPGSTQPDQPEASETPFITATSGPTPTRLGTPATPPIEVTQIGGLPALYIGELTGNSRVRNSEGTYLYTRARGGLVEVYYDDIDLPSPPAPPIEGFWCKVDPPTEDEHIACFLIEVSHDFRPGLTPGSPEGTLGSLSRP